MIDQDFLKTIDTLMENERWAEVIAAAEPKLAEEPSSHQLEWNIGWAYFKLDRYAEAESHLRKAVDHGPVDHTYYRALGVALSYAEQYHKAETWLLRALAVRDSYVTRISLALVYMKQDLAEAAEAVHKEGIRLKPNSRERLEAYADFLSDVGGREDEAEKMYEEAKRYPAK
jgi:tetratricopeptide (TPR) repeat protein